MNSLLTKHKPKDITKEQWEKTWENSSYVLEPFLKALEEMCPKEKITVEDFKDPSFVEKLVWKQAQRDFLEKIKELLPKSLTKI